MLDLPKLEEIRISDGFTLPLSTVIESIKRFSLHLYIKIFHRCNPYNSVERHLWEETMNFLH